VNFNAAGLCVPMTSVRQRRNYPMRSTTRTSKAPREPLLDAGWLFLLAGLALIASAVMIPAARDLDRAHWRRDRVLLTEMHRLHRLTRHEAYLGAVRDEDEAVVYQLAATQLGLVRDEAEVVELIDDGPTASTSVFASLEPPAIELPAFTRDRHPAREARERRAQPALAAGDRLDAGARRAAAAEHRQPDRCRPVGVIKINSETQSASRPLMPDGLAVERIVPGSVSKCSSRYRAR
jgi:hypothetical protein